MPWRRSGSRRPYHSCPIPNGPGNWAPRPETCKGELALRRHADAPGHDRIASQEIAHRAIVPPRRAHAELAVQAEAAPRPRHQMDIGVEIDDADAVDPVVVDPSLQRTAVNGVVEIGQHDGGGVHPVAVDLQIVADELARRIGEVALHAKIVQQTARRRIEAGDAAGGGADRNADAVGVDHRAAAGLQILDPSSIEGELLRRDVIVEEGRRHRPIEDHRSAHVAALHLLHDRAGGEQGGIDPERAELALAQVDQAVRRGGEGRGFQRSFEVHPPFVQSREQVDIKRGGRQPVDRPGKGQPRPYRALGGEIAVAGGEHDVRQLALA